MREEYGLMATCFLLGAAFGAAAALLLAPQSGRRTRRALQHTMEQGVDSITETGQEVYNRGKQLAAGAAGLVGRAQAIVK